ncbi:MAG TPA: hypothetical protein VJB13_03240 [Candidatus Nanoarchaeia archaeon]|nr:hypothetical protein [Candidatus Nanoarchaeia archaeon]
MHQYQVLLIEKEFPGLHILTTESYASLKQQQPPFPHEDWGDFYSEVGLDSLADTIYQSLQNNGVAEDARIISVRSFDEKNCDPDKDYIIKEVTGVRIYSPSIHSAIPQDEIIFLEPEVVYFLVSTCFLEDLFSPQQEGSLQREFKQLERVLNRASTKF